LDVNNSGSLLHQRPTVDPGARQPNNYTNMTFRASARAASTTPESLTTSDDRASDKKQPPNPVAQQTNDHNTSMTSDLGPTAPDSVSTSHALNAIVVAPNSIGTIDGGRSRQQQQRLGRPVLRPPPRPQVAPMAPGYAFLRGTRFDKNIGLGRKQELVPKTNNPEYNTTDIRGAEQKMYQLHDHQDRMGLKRHFKDIDIHGPQLEKDKDPY
jgi:hypothetical protein